MKIAISAVGSELHAVCLTDTGTLFHCIRHEDGQWDKWATLHPGGVFRDVSCASMESALHVIGTTDAGLCLHRIRDKKGDWTEFSELPHQPMFEGYTGE
jgi:hypothetical protein